MGLNAWKPAKKCPANPELKGKRGDWDYNELLKKSRFKVFTEDDKQMAFDKLA
jgi:hypothetical protein